MPPHPSESPAKKQSKWSPEEDSLIIELRGSGMKWEDISKRLPGRSAISCRLHYQNYLERRSEWDEERKNKLARLYERFKPEMWSKVAEEMAVPWRAAEAMHWQLGEQDMARRAGVVPFSLSSVSLDAPPPGPPSNPNPHQNPNQQHQYQNPNQSQRSSGHSHSSSTSSQRFPHGSSARPGTSSGRGEGRGDSSRGGGGGARTIAARRESTPRSVPPPSPNDGIALAAIGSGMMGMGRGQGQGQGQILPSVAEMTTGVSPYTTPAYAMNMPMPVGYSSPGPGSGTSLPSIGGMMQVGQGMGGIMGSPRMGGSGYGGGGNGRNDGKRRASPDSGPRESTRRRQ